MNMPLFSSRYGELTFTHQIPPEMELLVLPHAQCWITTPCPNRNAFLFQELQAGALQLRWYHFFSTEKDTLVLPVPAMTTLRIALSHSHRFYLPCLGKQLFHERNFNLFHLPGTSIEYMVGPSETCTFMDIILPENYLQSFTTDFPIVNSLLQAEAVHAPRKLSVYHQLAHAAFLQWVDDLPGAEDLPAIIHQLVRSGLEMLQYSPVPKKIRMQPADLEKIYQVADYLRSAKEELLIEELAQQFKISVYKLNTGFKQVYGHLILQHRQEEKMRLARQLLKEQQYSVKQVAYMLNYYPQNFVRAFKQRFGYTPGRNLFYP